MTLTTSSQEATGATSTDRVLVLSNDAHVGPPIEDFRAYCPKKFLGDFDEFVQYHAPITERMKGMLNEPGAHPEPFLKSMESLLDEPMIHYEPHEALRHMDEEGRVVETMFHGAMNGNPIPFLGSVGISTGKPWQDDAHGAELAQAGMRMYNRWLADYCSVAPERFIGLAQIPLWDVELSVKEMEFAREVGLKGINFPAPRPTLPDYNELLWEPVWSAAESLGLPLSTHGASSPIAANIASYTGIDSWLCRAFDFVMFSRRAVTFMILGGVFERHPNLKLLFTEQPANWVTYTLNDLDGLWAWKRYQSTLPRKPSEYFWSNCYIGLSFMSNREAREAVDEGLERNILWGSDYPHVEGTWPHTRLSLRKTFAGIPEEATRRMVGMNLVEVFGLEFAELQPIADRIGPTMSEMQQPLGPHDEDAVRWGTLAFRNETPYA